MKLEKNELKFVVRFVIVLVVVFGGFVFLPLLFSDKEGEVHSSYPPIDLQGHSEESPADHVLKNPMPILIQKHMLEHADGDGAPGVIISYNCDDFVCEFGLVEKLELFAKKYDFVYVAPFPGMKSKIVLTKYGKLDKLETFDEARIVGFIEGKSSGKGDLSVSSSLEK